jgi:hypothetical protein
MLLDLRLLSAISKILDNQVLRNTLISHLAMREVKNLEKCKGKEPSSSMGFMS